jgi:uncharacterized protein YijF (DUF1287 family)
MADRNAGTSTHPGAWPAVVPLAAALALGAAGTSAATGRLDPEAIVEGARLSIARAPRYDGAYVRIAFPGGDPGWDRGACSDLVVRAFRQAGLDLQVRVHDDIRSRPREYGVDRADASIDHRRVRHLRTYFERHALAATRFEPGDVVIWDLKGGTTPNHIGIVSDRRGPSGALLVIHHMNRVGPFTGHPGEDDSLRRWPIVGHFRWPGPRPAPR